MMIAPGHMIGEKTRRYIVYTYMIAMQVHQNRVKSPRCTKIKLGYVCVWYRIQLLV